MVSYLCEKCGKETNHKNDHRKHVITCKGKKKAPKQYECKYCYKLYTRKDNLKRHQEKACKAKDCQLVVDEYDSDTDNDTDGYECRNCSKIFSRKWSLNRHLDGRCNVLKKMDEEKDKIMKELIASDGTHQSIVNSSDQQANAINNGTINGDMVTNTITNNNLNNNPIFNLVKFGNEDISFITDSMYSDLLKQGFLGVPKMVEMINFDKNRPENHNVYVPSYSRNKAMAYNGSYWQLCDKDDILSKMIIQRGGDIEEKFYELEETLPDRIRIKGQRFVDHYDDKDKQKFFKNNLSNLLYNKKHIPIETKKSIGNNDDMKLLDH